MNEIEETLGIVTNKSNLTQVVIEVKAKELSMNEFIVIHHNQLDRKVLCQVADISYKEKRGQVRLLAVLNVLETIPQPFKPKQVIERAINGMVAKVLNLEENENFMHIGNLIGHDIGVHLNPNSLILKHLAVLGKTGSGKTYTVGVLIEEMIKIGLTAVVVDPHGDYGYMAEYYPDKMIAKTPELRECMKVESLYNKGKITVLDLLKYPSIEQPMYVMDIADTLFKYARAGKIDPFQFVVDECHNFAPQIGYSDSKNIMATVSGEGRKFGMGLCAITQRPARINKNVLSQCNTQIILRVSNPNDVKAIMSSVEGVRKEDKKKIQMLDIGQALIIGSNIKMPQYVQIKQKKCGEKESKKVI
jgi:DNA helicase HerA-like ATPase